MLIEGEQLLAGDGVPDLAGTVIAASDEFVSTLVKCAICQGQQMSSKDFEQCKLLLLVFKLLFNQLYCKRY